MIFDHGGCPRDRRRGAARMNLHAIRTLRGLNQDRPFTQAQIVRPVFEAKRGVGREPHNRFIWKSQLSA